MKKLFLLSIFVTSIYTFSQELDQAYLESLPASVRADVMEQKNGRDELEKTVYRRPSSMVRKRYCEEGINRNDKIENEYKNQLPSNDYYNNNDCIEKSERFGSTFFDMMQTSFMPINEPNFDSSYVLDFGDILQIQLTGQKNSLQKLPIQQDGSINIQEIGKIFIAGMSLETVNNLVKNTINDTYVGTESFITLVNVRDIQVLITGNAFNPGIYTLNGNSNVLHALSMAGGIDEIGSYRQVDVIRGNKVIETIDLYDVFYYGKSSNLRRLRSGDSILVKPAMNIVTSSGAFLRPGMYELKADETFLDLFNYSNGFAEYADKSGIVIERLEGEEVIYINVKDLDELSDLAPISSDRLNVRAYERKNVLVNGAVKFPGNYAISNGETLYSIVQKAGGYNKNAYPFGGILNNKKALELNEKAVESLYTTFVQKLVTKGDPLFASESLPFALKELKKADTSGRIIAEFDLSVLKKNPELDTILDDGDEIIIPIQTQQVYIFGEVNNDGAIRYYPKHDIKQYISRAGGVTESADSEYIYVVHPNGEVNKFANNKISFFTNRSNDILVYPGSVIYVPRKVNSQEAAMVASIWAPIVSAMATSITALSVLDRN